MIPNAPNKNLILLQAHKLVLSVCSKFFQVDIPLFTDLQNVTDESRMYLSEKCQKNGNISGFSVSSVKIFDILQLSLDVQHWCGSFLEIDFQDVFAQPQAVPQAHNTVIYLKVALMTMMITLIIGDIVMIIDDIDNLDIEHQF